jgi:nucleotide-binding universal stress UspA family protein
MDAGHLIEVGTSETLYHQPDSEFTATFIGGGNVLVGRREREIIRLGSATLPLPRSGHLTDEGAPVRVLFRPETTMLQPERFAPGAGLHVLGQGVVVERIFAGALQRIVLEVEGLRGVRAVSPRVSYGQKATRVEVIQTAQREPDASFAPGQKLWIGLRDFHVLAPSGLKVLLCASDDKGGEIAAELGSLLAQATHGPATLLTVVTRPELVAPARARLEALRGELMPRVANLEMRVRVGASAPEILLEAQEGHYEVIALGQVPDKNGYRGLGSTARQVLEQAEIPVLLTRSPQGKFENILICTRGGEPGKTDVVFGGRVARRANAHATVLYVQTPQTTDDEQKRAARHLLQAEASLSQQGVQCKIKILDGGIVESILQQTKADNSDLIIIGAQAPRGRPRLRWQNLANQLLGSTDCPVLVVPMSE